MKHKLKLALVFAALLAVAGLISSDAAAAHTRTIRIAVTKNGFSPATINVETGHKLNLVFTRADRNNCAGEVVFPELNIRRALPVRQSVTISFTPTKAGTVTFTCGMGMYKGKVVIAEE